MLESRILGSTVIFFTLMRLSYMDGCRWRERAFETRTDVRIGSTYVIWPVSSNTMTEMEMACVTEAHRAAPAIHANAPAAGKPAVRPTSADNVTERLTKQTYRTFTDFNYMKITFRGLVTPQRWYSINTIVDEFVRSACQIIAKH